MRKCFRNLHCRIEWYKFGCHYASSTILRISEKLIDCNSCFRCWIGKYSCNNNRRHFFNNIDGIVKIHLVKYKLKLIVRKGIDKKLLHLRIHLYKHFCRKLFWKDSENNRRLFGSKLLKKLSYISRLCFKKQFSEFKILFAFGKFKCLINS